MRKTRFLALGALAFLAACDLFGPDYGPPAEMRLAKLPTDLSVAADVPLRVTVEDDEGRAVPGENVIWTADAGTVSPGTSRTDDEGVATATWTLGTVAGTQRITAAAGGVEASATATVAPGRLDAVLMEPTAVTMNAVGDTVRITATGVDAYGNETATGSIDWLSSAPGVASVTGGRPASVGEVISHAEGRVDISAATATVVGTAEVTVDQVMAALRIEPADPVLLVGETVALDARAVDPAGTPLDTAVDVSWASSNPDVVSVAGDGVATGVATGTAAITATTTGFTAEVTAEVRTGTRPEISGIAPSVLAAGDTAVITGSGFSSDPADIEVSVGGEPAEVLTATTTRLTARMPGPGTFPCGPTGALEVVVSVSGLLASADHPVAGAPRQALAVGGSVALFGADIACVELAEAGEYAVTVFNTSAIPSSTSAFRVRGTSSTAAQATEVRPRLAVRRPPAAAPAEPEELAHFDMLERNVALFERLGPPPAPDPAMARSLAAVTVGDIENFRIPDVDAEDKDICLNFINVGARAVHVGEHGVIWEDTLAPLAGTMDDRWTELGTEYDDVMRQVLVDYFGDPVVNDRNLDGDGKIAMLFSQSVNDFERSINGFVFSGDFFPTTDCRSSDQEEVFYARVPTVSGDGWDSGQINPWAWQMRATIIHEAKHLTSYATRVENGSYNWEASGLEEATARLAEEFYARALQGYGQGDNMGYDDTLWCERRVGTNWPDCDPIPLIMLKHFGGVYRYLEDPEHLSPFGPAREGDSSFYGSGWQLVRWALDHSGVPEAQFIKALINETTLRGPANLAARAGRSVPSMVADYTLAMAIDDHPSGVTPARSELDLPSWDTRDIIRGMNEDIGDPYTSAWPLPYHVLPAGDFQVDISAIQGGSAAFFQLDTGGAQLLEILSQSGGTAAGNLGLAIIRVR